MDTVSPPVAAQGSRPEPAEITSRELICEAIAWRLELRLYFADSRRLVEPYLYGRDAEGRDWLIAYQLEGEGDEGWRQMDVTGLLAAATLSYRFAESRPDPPSPEPALTEVYCSLKQ